MTHARTKTHLDAHKGGQPLNASPPKTAASSYVLTMMYLELPTHARHQIFKELAGPQGGGKRTANRNSRAQAARFLARLAVETVAGYAIWELYKTVTA